MYSAATSDAIVPQGMAFTVCQVLQLAPDTACMAIWSATSAFAAAAAASPLAALATGMLISVRSITVRPVKRCSWEADARKEGWERRVNYAIYRQNTPLADHLCPMPLKIDLARDESILGDFRNFERLQSIEDPSNHEVRLYAAAVRRLLIDNGGGLLAPAAASRGIKLAYYAVDTKAMAARARNGKTILYSAGGVKAFGLQFSSIECLHGAVAGNEKSAYAEWPLQTFLKQPVLFWRGVSLTRSQVVAYVANKAAGVHYDVKASGLLTAEDMAACESLRTAARLSATGPAILQMNFSAVADTAVLQRFAYSATAMDLVFYELLAIIQAMQASPAVKNLLTEIEAELNSQSSE